MDNWVKKYLGKGIDYDGAYGVQCVDLIKHFVKNVLGVEPQSIGNAIEYYNKRKSSSYLTDNFKWIDNSAEFIPDKGDVCVFTSKSGNGHVSVATGEGTTSYFYSYDQNYPKGQHEPMTKIKHTYTSFLGVLRPKNQSNINVSNAPIINVGDVITLTAEKKCYKGAGSASGTYTVEELIKKNQSIKQYLVSVVNTATAKYKIGTKCTVKKVKTLSNGNIWIATPTCWLIVYEKSIDKKYFK
jgi:hypothetical protein